VKARRSLRIAALPRDHPCRSCAARLETFCGVLEARQLEEFKGLGSAARAAARQCLFHEGDAADLVYNVTRGTLMLYRLLPDGRRQIASFVHPGGYLGLTLEDVHAYTAEALEAVEYCRFPRERFDRFADDHPEIGRELYVMAAHELAIAREQIVLLGRKTAMERVASFLLTLFDQARPRSSDWEIVRLPMTRTDLADHLGLTKETVSRAVTSLRQAGLIALIPDERVELLRRRGLEQLAGGGGCG
jgi:CRP/FNR family transcriptional regulator, anaerobic regulatory protein